MFEGRKALVGATLSIGLVAGCGTAPEAPPLAVMPEVQNVQVACVEVNGFPAFTDADCQAYADQVKRGFDLFSQLTGNVISPPKNVVPKHYTKPLPIDNAREKRCLRVDGDNKESRKRSNDFAEDVAKAALSQAVDIDFSNSALYVTANGPLSLCKEQGPKLPRPVNHAEHCTPTIASYAGGQAMTGLSKPVILTFTTPDNRLLETTAAHERGHWGRGETRLGHEYVLCAKKSDDVPAVIHNIEPDLDVDIEGQRGSLMSYADNKIYLAPPHLAYLGVIPQGRVIDAKVPSDFNLREATQQGLAVQLPLSNIAIKTLIGTQFTAGLKPDDYRLWVGKIPGQQGVGVYAAPPMNKQRPSASIFLLDIVTPNHPFTLEGDVTVTENREYANTASIHIDKPNVK